MSWQETALPLLNARTGLLGPLRELLLRDQRQEADCYGSDPTPRYQAEECPLQAISECRLYTLLKSRWQIIDPAQRVDRAGLLSEGSHVFQRECAGIDEASNFSSNLCIEYRRKLCEPNGATRSSEEEV